MRKPTDFIRDEMMYKGWGTTDLARALQLSEKVTDGLLSGDVQVDADIAERLARAMSIAPGIWLKVQEMDDEERGRTCHFCSSKGVSHRFSDSGSDDPSGASEFVRSTRRDQDDYLTD